MARQFPHLKGSSEDVYGYGRETFEQITGDFDYNQWQQGATLTLMSVPWGVYDAGIMTDRPGFDTTEARDKWFTERIASATNTTESHVLDTLVRYQMKDYVDLPFTFDYTSLYNYLIVDYPSAPVSGGTKGIKRWFFHITSIDYSAPSTTRVSLIPDWWTTVAPLLDISHMVLARGHAPVAETSVSAFLANPIANSEMLLAPDVDYGTNTIVASQKNDVLNSGTVYAVICTKNVQLHSVGSSHYSALPTASNLVDGLPSDYQIAVNANNLWTFLKNWESQAPQTVQALDTVYLCSDKLINLGDSGTLFGVTFWFMSSKKYTSTTKLTQESFGYAGNIKHLAKLYTSPYAHIEVADSEGNTTTINVEDLASSEVSIECALNGAFPWLNISTHILGNGGAKSSITFRTTQANEFTAGGKWYETLVAWKVPCFSIYQSNASANDYKTHWSREQRKNDTETVYSNTTASAATAKTNADNSAATAAQNNAVMVAAATNTVSNTINSNNTIARAQVTKLSADWDSDFSVSSAQLVADQNAVGLAAANNEAISNATMASQFISGLGSALTGDVGGVISSATGIATTGVTQAASQASFVMSQSNNSSLYKAATSASSNKLNAANVFSSAQSGASNSTLRSNTAINNNASTSTTNNSAALVRQNASNTQSTTNANAARTRTNTYNSITNSINEAALQAPLKFGVAQNGEYASTRPMVLSVNVITESKSAIKQAATQFLRYGYALNQAFDFESWNCMKNFTYWQVSDIWATGVDSVPEEGQDAVRRMLYNGVTCWRDPDKIGKVSIYDN